MSASLVREYRHPDKQYADAAGNVQVLPNGNVFVGWGRALAISEFSKDGKLLFDARLLRENKSYRAFRFPWSGQPTDDPAMVAELGAEDEVTIYASWNGATEVVTWQVLAGAGPNKLSPSIQPLDRASRPSSRYTPPTPTSASRPSTARAGCSASPGRSSWNPTPRALQSIDRTAITPITRPRCGTLNLRLMYRRRKRRPFLHKKQQASSKSADLRGYRTLWRASWAEPCRRTRSYGLIRSPSAGTDTSKGREALHCRISCSLSCRI